MSDDNPIDESAKRLATAVSAAKLRLPSDAQIARLASAIGVVVPPPPSAPPPPSPPSPTATPIAPISPVILTVATLLSLGAVGTLITVLLASSSSSRPVPQAQPAPVEAPPIVAPAYQAVPLPLALPNEAPAHEALQPSRARRRQPSPPSAPPATTPPALSPEQDNRASAAREEAELIQRAESFLQRDPDQSLRLAQEHRRRFATGFLGEEREVIIIDALLRLHRRVEAEQRAAAFDAAHPGSVHSRRIHRLMGTVVP